MEEAIKLIRDRTELSDTTFKQYVSQINNLYKIWGVAEDYEIEAMKDPGVGGLFECQFLLEIRGDPSKIITLIETAYSHGTAKTYLNIIIVYVRSYIDMILSTWEGSENNPVVPLLLPVLESYRTAWKKFQVEYEKQVSDGVMTQKQHDSFLTWKQFDEIIQKGVEKWGMWSQQVLTFMLYRHLPLRADYASLLYLHPGKGGFGGNVYNGKEFIINNYKTFKTYGPLTSEPPLILKQYLDEYIVNNGMGPRAYFYPDKKKAKDAFNPTNTHITNNLLSKRVRNYFLQLGVENPPNIQMLRHIYLINKYGEVKKEMDNDAYIMGHSKTTQDKYILKFGD